MKKLLFIFAWVLCLPLFSQTFFYSLHFVSAFEIEEDQISKSIFDMEESSGMISVEEGGNMVIVLPGKRIEISLLEKIDMETMIDSDGDEYVRHIWNSIDGDKSRCAVVIDDYSLISDTIFFIKYNNVIFIYYTTFLHKEEKKKRREPDTRRTTLA